MFIPSFQDVIRGSKTITEEVILLVVYNLLGVVEKLHNAEIVHGDLNPDVFFLGDRFVSLDKYGRRYNTHFCPLLLLCFCNFPSLTGELVLQSRGF